MKKVLLLLAAVGMTFFIGALLGVQHMNEELGISTPDPLSIEKKESKQTKTAADARESELIEKTRRVEQVGHFNFFSDMGRFVAETANEASRTFLAKVMTFVQTSLNGER